MSPFGTDFPSRRRRALSAGCLALALALCGGAPHALAAGSDDSAPPIEQVNGLANNRAPDTLQVQIKELAQSAQQRVTPRVITLPALNEPKDAPLPEAKPGQPLQIGVARNVAEAADSTATAALWNWTQEANGLHRAAISVRSADAAGLRLGLRVEQLPPGTQLRVYAPDSETTTEIAGTEVLRALQLNLDAGATGADAYTYWLPTVDGSEAVLEVELAAGIDPASLKVSLPQVSHLKVGPAEAGEMLTAASSCGEVDVMCTTGYEDISHAVAMMSFVSGGGSYACTGTLVNDTAGDFIPYFLSANHCISTQAAATSLQTYWNYRSASCNSSQTASNVQRIIGGAQLLYATTTTDTSFMRLNGAVPSNAYFAGWTNAPASAGASIFDIHQPGGGLQKISSGSVTAFATCSAPGSDGSFSCITSAQGSSTFYTVTWSSGVTEGGSSGSALFSASSKQIIGQLYGGSSSCTDSSGVDVYGRFDLAYNASLKTWLGASATPPPSVPLSPVYRFFNDATGAHFYTASSLERDTVIASFPTFHYEGVAYQVYANAQPATSAVYRFFNTATGVHFYTISADQRDIVLATLPTFSYDGIAWYAQPDAGNGTTAVYRFHNHVTGAHFYIMGEAGRDAVIASYPDFDYEGVAYYAWPAP